MSSQLSRRDALPMLVGIGGAQSFLIQYTLGPRTQSVAGLPDPWAWLGIAYLVGWGTSLIRARDRRVFGESLGMRLLSGLLVAGLVCAALQQVQDATGRRPFGDVAYMISDLAWPLSHVMMIPLGIAAYRARLLSGWRRFAPLVCGLALPVSLAIGAVVGRAGLDLTFPIGTSLCFTALALSLGRAPEAA